MTLGTQVGLGPGHIVLDGDPVPPPQRGTASQFSARLDGSRCHLVRRWASVRRHCVRWGTSSPSPKGAQRRPPIFGPCPLWPNGWLDEDVTWYGGRHGHPAPPEKRHSTPIFGACLLWPNGWMDEDATWYGSRPRPRPHCVKQGTTPLPPSKGAQQPPVFLAHVYCGHGCLPISATGEVLYLFTYIQNIRICIVQAGQLLVSLLHAFRVRPHAW